MLRHRMTARHLQRFVSHVAAFIAAHQLPSGAIPWHWGGVTDPWDHVECAISLDLCGLHDEAARAYRWLAEVQNRDGSWWYTYRGGQPEEMAKDGNHSAYLATGVWYHHLATRDVAFLREMWPAIDRGLGFTLGLQQPSGIIFWARDASGEAWPSALLSASSGIYQSICHGLRIAAALDVDRPAWHAAAARLRYALTCRPDLFDTGGEDRRGYAMNWYYPVLAGVLDADVARHRIDSHWRRFVVDGRGCLCSLDQPWVTVAETAELAAALAGIGDFARADRLLEWVLPLQDSDGGFWTGVNHRQNVIYPPDHKTTWTAAGVIIALLADSELAAGSRL